MSRRLTAGAARPRARWPLILIGALVAALVAAAQVAASAAPGDPPLRIMPLGDSLTHGNNATTAGAYRRELGQWLTAAGVSYDFVGSQRYGTGFDSDHEGHRGWRIRDLHGRVDDWLATYRPNLVLLHVGTNDLWKDDAPAAAPARLGGLIDAILASSPGVRVIVATITVPPASRPAGWRTYSPRLATLATRARAYDAAVPGIVAARGPRASLVDLSRVSAANTVDGVHLTTTGYRQVAYQWYRALRRVLSGTNWPTVADPFPAPKLSVAVSASRIPAGGTVVVTGRLRGALTAVDLGGKRVQILWRPAGTTQWRVLRSASTTAQGIARLSARPTRTGDYALRVLTGRAAGRTTAAVQVTVSGTP